MVRIIRTRTPADGERPEESSTGSSGTSALGGRSPDREGRSAAVHQEVVLREGLQLAEDLRAWLRRFIVTMDEHDIDLLVLWIMHTHVVLATGTTPRLLIDSPVPGSGKTTLLEHLDRLCFDPIHASSINSAALLTRLIKNGPRTILIDEADRTLAPDKQSVPELLAVLNSGYKVGATRPVLVPRKGSDYEPEEMPTYAPVAMAGNNPKLPQDTESRSLRVLLLPDTAGVAEESDWEVIEDDARELAERIAAWAEAACETVRQAHVHLPAEVVARHKERWRPLKRVAVALGGPWPEIVDRLASTDVARIRAEQDEGLQYERQEITLLKDLHAIWGPEEKFLPTEELLERLEDHRPDLWGTESRYGKSLTPQRLGALLARAFKVHSTRRATGRRERGYLRSDFQKAFNTFQLAPEHEADASGAPDAPDGPDAPSSTA